MQIMFLYDITSWNVICDGSWGLQCVIKIILSLTSQHRICSLHLRKARRSCPTWMLRYFEHEVKKQLWKWRSGIWKGFYTLWDPVRAANKGIAIKGYPRVLGKGSKYVFRKFCQLVWAQWPAHARMFESQYLQHNNMHKSTRHFQRAWWHACIQKTKYSVTLRNQWRNSQDSQRCQAFKSAFVQPRYWVVAEIPVK